MKRSKLFTIIGSVCLMLVIAALPFMAACAAPAPTPTPAPVTPTPVVPTPAPTPEKVIELKWSTAYAAMHPMCYDCYNIWLEEVEKRSNGRVATTIFPSGSLSSYKDNLDAIEAGMADMGEVWANAFMGLFPAGEMYYLPFIAPTSSIASTSLYESTTTHPELINEWKAVHFLSQHSTAIMNLHTSKTFVKTLEDMKGLILGTDSPKLSNWLKRFGAGCENIPTADAYLAIEKGVIEGGIWPWAPLRSFKLTEFLKYHTVLDVGFIYATQVMNIEKWDSLPEDIQGIIDEIDGYEFSALAGYTLTNGSLVDIAYMKDKGDEFYTLPPDEKKRWAALIEGDVQVWLDDMAAIGVDGEKLWSDLHDIVAKYEANPYPEPAWAGADAIGRYGSPNRPGGWD